MHQLIIATRNEHKTREFAQILGHDFAVTDLSTHLEIPEVTECGATFAENAKLKALAASKTLPGLIIADDSGLEVDALEGAPGIFSARYAGENARDKQNIDKLLHELARTRSGAHERSARFRCVILLARNGQLLGTFEGIVAGTLVDAPRGAHGFGYDPIFMPNGFDKTFAQLPAETKNRISHRARAVQKLAHYLNTALPSA